MLTIHCKFLKSYSFQTPIFLVTQLAEGQFAIIYTEAQRQLNGNYSAFVKTNASPLIIAQSHFFVQGQPEVRKGNLLIDTNMFVFQRANYKVK